MIDDAITEEAGVQLTPTLVVGIGGTGFQVVERVKESLHDFFAYRNLGEVPPIFRFLSIDSVARSFKDRDEALGPDEYVYLGNVNADEIIRNPRYHPEIAGWWDTRRSSPGHIDDGCGQMRDAGRLVFHARYNEFYKAMRRQVNGLLLHENLLATQQRGFQLRRGQVRVCVVCSVAGGTGSGMFLDVAYNLRDALSRMAGTDSLVGYLVLPEVYVDQQDSLFMKESIQANGYASLVELECMNRQPEDAVHYFHEYPGGHTIRVQSKPFDHTFLVGIRDQRGEALSSADQVFDAISQKIVLEAVYLDQAMMEKGKNTFADSDVGGGLADTGIGRYYSSFSVNTVTIRRDIALGYCSARLGLDVMNHLLADVDEEHLELPPLPSDLDVSGVVKRIEDSLAATHPYPSLSDSPEVESAPLIETLDDNERTLAQWLADTRAPIQDAVRSRRRDLQQHLHDEAWRLALTHGIDAVFPYLRAWQRRLEEGTNSLGKELSTLRKSGDAQQAQYEHDRAELDEIALGPSLGGILTFTDGTAKRRHRRERLFKSAGASLQSAYRTQLRQSIVSQVLNSLVHSLLGDTARDEHGSVTRLQVQWDEIQHSFGVILRELESTLENLGDTVDGMAANWEGFMIARELTVSRGDLEGLYTQIAPIFDKQQFVRQIAADVEAEIDDDEETETSQTVIRSLRNRMLQVAQQMCLPLFAPGAERDSDQTLSRAAAAVHLALSRCMGTFMDRPGVVGEMFTYNTPFWNFFESAGAEQGLERTNLIAVESDNPVGWDQTKPEDILEEGRGDEALPDEAQNEQIVATSDPGLFAVYRASYGLPLFLINELADLQIHYNRRRERNVQERENAKGMSLHIAADWNDRLPCDPTLDREGHPVLADRFQ